MKRLAMTATAMTTMTLSSAAMGIEEYRNDDGAPEQNIGVTGGGAGNREIAWLNRFVVQPGEEIITGMRVAFGDVPNGIGATAILLFDSNQDGNPDDAVFLAGLSSAVSNANATTPVGWAYFDLPDTTLMPGDIIFAGVIVDVRPTDSPARIDFDGNDEVAANYPPNNHSFIAADTINQINPSNLGGAQLPVASVSTALGMDGTWLIRLDAVSINGPCPADLNGDLIVDSADLAILLADWNGGLADLNVDGIVDSADLAILLAAWGPCP